MTTGTRPTKPRIRLNARDIEVIDAVHRLRVLSSEQIAQLFFPSTYTKDISSNCRRRLRGLVSLGLLHEDEQETKRTAGSRPKLYMLTRNGIQLLQDELGYEPEDIDWSREYLNVRWPFLRHQLAINDAFVAFTLGAAAIGWEIVQWIDDRILRKQHVERIFVPEAGADVAVIPDAYFVLEGPGGKPRIRFYLEIDQATTTIASSSRHVKSWKHKIHAYSAYFMSDAIVERYGTRRIRVLTVASSASRADNLKTATEEEGGKSRYWFTNSQSLSAASCLSLPIWMKAGVSAHHRLVTQ